MTVGRSERAEALAISGRVIDALMSFPIASTGGVGADLRSAVGQLLSNFSELIVNESVGTELFGCFEAARLAGATLDSMDTVRTAMFAEAPVHRLGTAIVNGSIIFSLVEQSQIITAMTFASRIEAETVLDRMVIVIEDIKITKADSFVASDYRNVVTLSALLIQHLSATERQLPRVVKYHMPVNYPALALSNRIYGEGSRSEELIAENKTVHPAFMQRDVIALSA